MAPIITPGVYATDPSKHVHVIVPCYLKGGVPLSDWPPAIQAGARPGLSLVLTPVLTWGKRGGGWKERAEALLCISG